MRASIKSVAIISVFVVGCQSGPRPFDGNLGFRILSSSDTTASLSYVEEASKSLELERKKVAAACAGALKVPASKVSLEVVSTSAEEKFVNMSVLVPTTMIPTGESKNVISGNGMSGSSSPIMSVGHSSETFQRKIKLRTSIYSCSISAGSP